MSAKNFTERQGQYLAFIDAYTRVNGRPPAESDMQRRFGVSPPSVHQMVLTLERLGLIRRQPGVARSSKVLLAPKDLPVLRHPEPVKSSVPRNWWVVCRGIWHSDAPGARFRRSGRCVHAPEPPSRWIGSPPDPRPPRPRLPFHTNGVGCAFQARAVCSNQLPISSGLCGCCPSSARRLSTRSIDSAMLSQLPPTGV